jgi:hypothetical protein
MYQALLEECYPSLRINIWCYPTSRVLSTFFCSLLVNGLVYSCLKEDVGTWWKSLDQVKMRGISDEEFENVFLEKRFHAKSKERNMSLFSCGNSILQVHGCIHK